MLGKWTVVLAVFIFAKCGALGGPSPRKPSDFSMYDNQFYRVGDTELDDEVTDCAIVEHQFKKGYIRLREYLERKRGCGRKGKMQNIVGIEKSTEDDVNNDNIAEIAKSTTEDYDYKSSSYAHGAPAKQAPKLTTIPQVINTYQPRKMAHVPHRYALSAKAAVQQPAVHVSVPRNQASRPTISDYESRSQDLALSFKNNPQYKTMQASSLEDSHYKSQNTQYDIATAYNNNNNINDQYSRLASNNDNYDEKKPQHDLLQTFYPDTLHARSHAPETVAVGPPLYVTHPATRTQTPLKPQNTAANKVSPLLKNAMKNFDQSSVNKPSNASKLNGAGVRPHAYNTPVTKPTNADEKSSQNEDIDDAHADMRDPDKDVDDNTSQSIDQEPPPETGIDDEPADQTDTKPGRLPVESFKKPAKQVFVAKGNPMFVKRPPNISKQALSAPTIDNINLRQPSINFDVLKNKIMHSTNTTFLRRMLTLIQKITHHKDYQKLKGPARSFVAQAKTAVQALNKAYSEGSSSSPVSAGIGNQLYGNDFALRKKSTLQMPRAGYNNGIVVSSGNQGNGNLYENAYELRKKSAVQTPSIAYHRIMMSPDYQETGGLYGNVYALRKKSAVQRPSTTYKNRIMMSQGNLGNGNFYDYAPRKKTTVLQALNGAYNNRMATSSVNPGTVNQFYGNDYSLSKKFQIARNPYYQSYYQYRQPYYSNIESMRYGLYNGNTP